MNEYTEIWKETLENVLKNGVKICKEGENWELWRSCDMIYSIPIVSGCRPSYWCTTDKLREHLYHLRHVCGYNTLIPPAWENVNMTELNKLGIE